MMVFWKRIFIVALFAHGAFNILFYDNYMSFWEPAPLQIEFFKNSLFYYFINSLPVLEISLGLLLLFGYIRKSLLAIMFYVFLIAGYYALDSDRILSLFIYFSLAFSSMFILFGHYYHQCPDDKDIYQIPTGGM